MNNSNYLPARKNVSECRCGHKFFVIVIAFDNSQIACKRCRTIYTTDAKRICTEATIIHETKMYAAENGLKHFSLQAKVCLLTPKFSVLDSMVD